MRTMAVPPEPSASKVVCECGAAVASCARAGGSGAATAPPPSFPDCTVWDDGAPARTPSFCGAPSASSWHWAGSAGETRW